MYSLYKPEIVMLTDEDNSSQNLKKSDVKDTKVHGFAMSTKNDNLVKFALSTGGVGLNDF
jgi:hypothetical protein